MQYDPDDLIIVRCEEGHQCQMMYDADIDDSPCPFCGGAVREVEA